MQTFLPYPDFAKSLQSLDDRRLGKQRVEVSQLLNGSWARHPAARMWKGYETALMAYGNLASAEWERRGYENNLPTMFSLRWEDNLPWWVGWDDFHTSHRSALGRKGLHFPGWNNQGYVWPIPELKGMELMRVFHPIGAQPVQFAFPWVSDSGKVIRRRCHPSLYGALMVAHGTDLEIIHNGEVVETHPTVNNFHDAGVLLLEAFFPMNPRIYTIWRSKNPVKIRLGALLQLIDAPRGEKAAVVYGEFSYYLARARRLVT